MIRVVVWLLYAAVIYVTIFSLLIFLENGRLKQQVEWLEKWPTVTLAVPAYNEEDSIAMTLESILDVDYPEDKLEVIVVDDGSQDDTAEVVKNYTDDKRVKLIEQENKGKGGALNTALEASESVFFGCVDADSRLKDDSVKNIISNFDDDTAAIASAMKVYEPSNLLQKIQWMEYLVGIFMRNILGMINAIYVTPGPLSIYRRDVVEDMGGFDEESLVEDQEICFRLQKHHWKVKHSRKGEVYTIAPDNLRGYYNQRRRWYRGSLENMIKYKEMIFNRDYGDFGMFALPQNLLNIGLSMIVVFLMVYLTLQPLVTLFNQFLEIGFDAFMFSIPTFHELLKSVYWSILSTRFLSSILLGSLFSMSFFLAYLSARHTEESLLDQGVIPMLIYLAWYVIFTGVMWILVVLEVLLDRDGGW
jgi:cellulose synthase/poly-beta-1,6-N-acetylglucosamine synthase-like glycosyltransferase